MKATLEKVVGEALSLSLPDRSALTQILIQTLDPDPVEDAAEVQQAWQVEVEKRLDEILSGRVKTVPAEKVFAKLRPNTDEAGCVSSRGDGGIGRGGWVGGRVRPWDRRIR
jgi:putative addiction module component (TIGR02574 family)